MTEEPRITLTIPKGTPVDDAVARIFQVAAEGSTGARRAAIAREVARTYIEELLVRGLLDGPVPARAVDHIARDLLAGEA